MASAAVVAPNVPGPPRGRKRAAPDEPTEKSKTITKLTNQTTVKEVAGEQRFVCNWTGLPLERRFGVPLKVVGKIQGAFLDWGCVMSFLEEQVKREEITVKTFGIIERRLAKRCKFTTQSPRAPPPEVFEKFGKDVVQRFYMGDLLGRTDESQTIKEYVESADFKKKEAAKVRDAQKKEPPLKKSRIDEVYLFRPSSANGTIITDTNGEARVETYLADEFPGKTLFRLAVTALGFGVYIQPTTRHDSDMNRKKLNPAATRILNDKLVVPGWNDVYGKMLFFRNNTVAPSGPKTN